ncbi:MAG TPA: redoxin domain-containing protein [Phycisphaerales bacterium]|nr:redoxin domain-containing protein [Phycisphaerales bacterium]
MHTPTTLTLTLILGTAALAQPPADPPASPAPPVPAAAVAPAPIPAPPTLVIGDPAPALVVNAWIKGSPVESFAKGRVYAVEFWSTTAPPSRKTAPVLSELQSLFKDKKLTIIGVCVGEPGGRPEVEAYARRMGPMMGFTIAYDAEGRAAQAYLQASGQDSLPVAFVIDADGRVAWIGHPLDNLDRVLPQVLAGTHDLAKARAAQVRRAAADAKARPLITELENHFVAGETDMALEKMDALAAIDPPITGDWAVNKFAFILLQKKDPTKAYAYAAAALDGVIKDNADALKAISWMILDEPGVEPRDRALSLRLARRADELTAHADASVLDTLARALFETGRTTEAVKAQSLAVETGILPSQKREMEQRLRLYRGDKK